MGSFKDQEHKTKWLFQGDSVTDCNRNRPDLLPWGNGYVRIIAEQLAKTHPSIEIINRGISGHRTHDLLDRWQQDTLDIKPDRLYLLIGINNIWHKYLYQKPSSIDEYQRHLEQMLKAVQVQLPQTKIILLTPFLLPVGVAQPPWFDELDEQIQVLKKITNQNHYPLIHLQQLLKTFANPSLIAPDGVHPSKLGHQAIASEILEAFNRE